MYSSLWTSIHRFLIDLLRNVRLHLEKEAGDLKPRADMVCVSALQSSEQRKMVLVPISDRTDPCHGRRSM